MINTENALTLHHYILCNNVLKKNGIINIDSHFARRWALLEQS